jgi:MFS family permease
MLQRPIMASLHGLWSTAGFVGAAIGSVMMSLGVAPLGHFAVIFAILLIGVGVNAHAFLNYSGLNGPRARFFVRPTRRLLGLGLIAFCSMICEGAMFDWSGVYFQRVLHANAGHVAFGYGAFMSAMATSRFFADRLTVKLGPGSVLTGCGLLVASGLLVAVAYPSEVTGVLGFLLVGMGTSAVVPLVYSQAGKSGELAPSSAIAATSTIGFIGFLMGPPLIGWIAGLSSLRWSFLIIALLGLGISLVGRRQFRHSERQVS